MELTHILGRLKSDTEPPKPFLALELTNEVVQSAVWQVNQNKTEVVVKGPAIEWSGNSKNLNASLIEAVDKTISSAIESLEVEPTEVVFGLPATWTNEEGIKSEKLKLIKLITRELELKPLGFVVIIDSLLRYLKMQEGVPATSILIHVNQDEIDVYHVVQGKIKAQKNMVRNDDIALDVEEALSSLKIQGNLPSRIIIFDGLHNLEDLVQNLVSYNWQDRFQFLHLPKVESLPTDIVIKSIAIAGGAEVAKSIGFEIVDPQSNPTLPLKPKPDPINPTSPITTPAFGFSSTPPIPKEKPIPPSKTPSTNQVTKAKSKLNFPPLKLPKPKLALPKLSFPTLNHKFVILPIALLLLTSSVFASIWFIPHAQVIIYVKPKVLDEKIPITLSTKITQPNFTESIIPATKVPISVSGSDSINTTGEKTVGDKAVGEVTIFNRTEVAKLFKQGTTLKYGKLLFSLLDDVTVASASSGSNYEILPGKAKVKIKAQQIGEDSNLPANTEFAVSKYSLSTYVARNDADLSGGSSRQIQVVSQEDKSKLLNQLTSKLEEEAKHKLLSSSEVGSGVYLLEDSFEILKQSFSAQVGEEAQTLNADLEVSISALHYLNQDIEDLLSNRIAKEIPNNFIRTQDVPTVELVSANQVNESEITANAKVKIKLLPKIDQTSFKSSLRGLSTNDIKANLSSVAGLDRARVIITPQFIPPKWKKMPRNPNNISISIQPTTNN